jgi:hypothetical protein
MDGIKLVYKDIFGREGMIYCLISLIDSILLYNNIILILGLISFILCGFNNLDNFIIILLLYLL